jgi:hypothetical protein
MESERIFVYLSTNEKILKEKPVQSPDDAKYFEYDIERSIEGFIMDSFDIRRITCPTNTGFMPTAEEGLDHIRRIIEKTDYRTEKIDKRVIDEFFRETNKNFFFIVDRFDLPWSNSSFSQVWYCNMYMYHRILFNSSHGYVFGWTKRI